MWKVSNSNNIQILDAFCSFIIEPIFLLAIDLAERGISDPDDVFSKFETDIPAGKKIRDLYINKTDRKTFEITFLDVINQGVDELKKQYEIYQLQNRSLNYSDHNVPMYVHPVPFKDLFVKYFYEKFWGLDEIWTFLGYDGYSRFYFQKYFKVENTLFVCPFCDIDTISNKANSFVEHFLPKESYPFLSCTGRNLISTCNSCNLGEEGKGRDVLFPIVTPYEREIGNSVKFSFLNEKFVIEPNSDLEVENYIELLKLRDRYSSEVLFERAIRGFKFQYALLCVKPEAEMITYLREHGRLNGLYFLSRDILDMDIELDNYFQ
jgi:hypothetical protein